MFEISTATNLRYHYSKDLHKREEVGLLGSESNVALKSIFGTVFRIFKRTFLPVGYPDSVRDEYIT